MEMILKNNMGAIRTLNTLNKNDKNLQKSLSKVSTGMKINSAEDDASAYGISERMRVRMRALEQANQNTQNDSSLMKTAEGAVANTIEILKSLKEKAINAANDSNTDEDRATLQKEIDQLIDQIDDNALVTFNGKYLIDGSRNNAAFATKTVFLNQNLSTNTTASYPNGALVNLKNRVGDSLGIHSGDTWQMSWVINGTTNFLTGTVGNRTTLNNVIADNIPELKIKKTLNDGQLQNGIRDKANNYVYTTDGALAIELTVGADNNPSNMGIDNQLAGFTFSILDAEGNMNKVATAALQFNLFQRAENKSGHRLLNFQTGSEANQSIKLAFTDMRSKALGIKGSTGKTVSVATKGHANATINVFDNALAMALDQQTSIGAVLARLEYTSSNIILSNENVQSAESVIRDSDMAKEMTEYTKNNVLLQAAQSMLAQANQNSSAVLSLLQ